MVTPKHRIPLWWLGQRDPIARFTLYAVIIAALAMTVAALQGWILFNQLSAMKNENRPWVGFEIHQLNEHDPPTPLTAAIHCWNVANPQFVAPPPIS